SMEQKGNTLHARLELWDAARKQVLASRTVVAPISKPLEFLDRVYASSTQMAGLPPRPRPEAPGVRGPRTRRFLLQGSGRLRRAESEAQTQRALVDLELACRTEPEAAAPRGWLA